MKLKNGKILGLEAQIYEVERKIAMAYDMGCFEQIPALKAQLEDLLKRQALIGRIKN